MAQCPLEKPVDSGIPGHQYPNKILKQATHTLVLTSFAPVLSDIVVTNRVGPETMRFVDITGHLLSLSSFNWHVFLFLKN